MTDILKPAPSKDDFAERIGAKGSVLFEPDKWCFVHWYDLHDDDPVEWQKGVARCLQNCFREAEFRIGQGCRVYVTDMAKPNGAWLFKGSGWEWVDR